MYYLMQLLYTLPTAASKRGNASIRPPRQTESYSLVILFRCLNY